MPIRKAINRVLFRVTIYQWILLVIQIGSGVKAGDIMKSLHIKSTMKLSSSH